MLAVAVELLAGRYTATEFNDRNAPEWPPHPARLFSAMVAVWADGDSPSLAEQAALEWLETQAPPAITCGGPHELRRRSIVTHYVPVNDTGAFASAREREWGALLAAEAGAAAPGSSESKAAQRQLERARAAVAKVSPSSGVAATALQALPWERGRQGRTYPTVLPDTTTLWFTWPDADPSPSQAEALDGLLQRVGRLGHSSSFVSCRIVDWVPRPDLVVTPLPRAGDQPLRVPAPGSFAALRADHAFHQGIHPRTLPSGFAAYRRPHADSVEPPRSALGGAWTVLALPPGRTLGLGRSLDFTRSVRNALLAHATQPVPEVLSGHRRGPAPTPAADRPHLAVIPLASVGHPRSDGAIRGVALVLPAGNPPDDAAHLGAALASWRADRLTLTLPGHRGRPWELVEQVGRPAVATLRASNWCRPSVRWATVTPIALDRFPGSLTAHDPGSRARAQQEAEDTIARACTHLGLPSPVSVDVRLDPPIAATPAVRIGRASRGSTRYPMFRAGGSGQLRLCVHAVIRFPEAVRGPVLVGAGRYLGYGLCLPLDHVGTTR